MDFKVKLKTKYPHILDGDIEDVVDMAKSILVNIANDTIENLLPRQNWWVYRCCVEIVERNNMTSAISYSESGYSISFDRSQISSGLVREITPRVGIPYVSEII